MDIVYRPVSGDGDRVQSPERRIFKDKTVDNVQNYDNYRHFVFTLVGRSF
jgi:hypothetical protein